MSKVQNILGALGIRKPAQVAKAAKKATVAVSKPAAKAEAKGADALAAQNKAFIKNMKKPGDLQSTSGGGVPGGGGPGVGGGGGDSWGDIWGNSGSGSVWD